MLGTVLTTMMMLVAPSHGGEGIHEVSIEGAGISVLDPSWEMFSNDGFYSKNGLRAGYGFNENLTILGGWRRGARDVSVNSGYGGYDYDEYYYYGDYSDSTDQSMSLDFVGNEFSVGAKYAIPVKSWLQPYGIIQTMGTLGRIRVGTGDEDDDRHFYSFAPGAALGGGVDVVFGRADRFFQYATYLEGGYTHMISFKFDDEAASGDGPSIGKLSLNGSYINWGVGLRF